MGNSLQQYTINVDTKTEKCGVVDVPNAITDTEGDILRVRKYVEGLEKFIQKCPTPMSISLEGDWGSGKTTFLKTIEQDLKHNDKIKVVYFNTWSYSQFNDSDGLFFSLVSSIINQLPVEETGMKDFSNKILEKIVIASSSFIKAYFSKKISDFTGVDSNELRKILSSEVKDRSRAIECLKDEFTYLIKCTLKIDNNGDKREHKQEDIENEKKYFWFIQTIKYFMCSLTKELLKPFTKLINKEVVENDKTINELPCQDEARVVICIDDLDRLEPARAVELLEVLKLFMDVKHCVFVLAIDHEVVVDGVKSKYGSEMSDDKCNLFFDKIIQLPFRMPIEAYKFDRLLDDSFEKDFLNEYKDIIYKFINDKLENNPRTIKRFINRCYLLSKILESDNIIINEEYYCFILMIIAIQISDEKVYNTLLYNAKIKEEFKKDNLKKLLEDAESTEQNIEENEQSALDYLSEVYNSIKKIYDKKQSSLVDLITIFSKVLEPSRSTTINNFYEENLFYMSVGNEHNKATQHSKSMLQLVNALLSNIDASKISELIKNNENLGNWMKFNGKKGNSYFRSILETSVKNKDGDNIYIGVSTKASTKSSQIKDLIRILKDKNYIDKDIDISWIKYEDDEPIDLLNL